jgi:hypothetical protein
MWCCQIELHPEMHMFAYGQVVDACDQYCKIGESITFKCLWHFVKVIKEVFEPKFLRKPTQVNLEKQLTMNAERG